MPCPSARRRISSLPTANALLATISETTSPAPKRRAISRNGKSVMPDIGAKKTALGTVTVPMDKGDAAEWMGVVVIKLSWYSYI